jgi:transcriptional regulator with XRE-family HTH domain
MSKTLKDKIKQLPEGRKQSIKSRANELIAQEMTLRDLRKALHLTQEEVAGVLHMNQESVSRLERRSDLLLSTLAAYIESMGGKLKLIAEFPNRPPVYLLGFEDIEQRC